MECSENDRRKHRRRVLQVPVICYPSASQNEPKDWIFGKTIDVGTDGLRIRFRGTCLLEPGTELDLLFIDHHGQGDVQTEVPACIRARVSWVKKAQQVFEVEYLESCQD